MQSFATEMYPLRKISFTAYHGAWQPLDLLKWHLQNPPSCHAISFVLRILKWPGVEYQLLHPWSYFCTCCVSTAVPMWRQLAAMHPTFIHFSRTYFCLALTQTLSSGARLNGKRFEQCRQTLTQKETNKTGLPFVSILTGSVGLPATTFRVSQGNSKGSNINVK